jgi:uncharacterized membrane protein HdeD (DUF308 family)
MRRFLAVSWWMLALRGAAGVLFGVLALAWPVVTLLFLVALFAFYTLVVGALAVFASLKSRTEQGWWLVFLLGIVGIVLGVVSLMYPRMTALALVLIIQSRRAHHGCH